MMLKISDIIMANGLGIEDDSLPVKIHQPTIKEIAEKGKGKFFISLGLLYAKPLFYIEFINGLDYLSEEERERMIDSATSYDNLFYLLKATAGSNEMREERETLIEMLDMIFKITVPTHSFSVDGSARMILSNSTSAIEVDGPLFFQLTNIFKQIFLLDKFFDVGDDKKRGKLSAAAQRIADKMAKSEEKIKKLKGEKEQEFSTVDDYLARIISIMSVSQEIIYLNSLTTYQLYNLFERYNLFVNYNQGVQAMYAGATDVELVDWYKKI